MSFKVSHHEGDSSHFHATPTVVNAFLEGSQASSELTDFHFDNVLLFLALLVVHDFGVRLPCV